MSKKKFLSAKKFLILIIFFLFFSENTFGFSFDSRKNFYENFYSDVYDETDYKKKSLERVSNETGLDEDFLLGFYNGSGSVVIKCEKENNTVSQFCKAVENGGDNGRTNYENILKNKINSELKLVKLEQKLRSTAENEEIFADGDYKNSFFDVVTQWNVIDVILFGKEGMTPFFKYKDNKKDENKPENKKDSNKPDKKIETQKENKYKSDQISFFDNKTQNNSENNSEKIKNGFYLNTIKKETQKKKKLEICVDPHLIDINSINKKTIAQKGEKLTDLDKILQENNKISSINSEKTKNEIENNVNLQKNQKTKNGFIEPKDDDGKKCKKPLYGGYICLDSNSFGKCFPIGKKLGGGQGENGSFCVDINMIKGAQDLFGNGKDVNCVNCYIEKGLNIIEDKIYGEALFPRENSLNNGNLPNLVGTKRSWLPLDISFMAMPWEKENYKKNEEKPHINLEEKYNPEANPIIKSEGDIKKLEKILSEKKTVNNYKNLNKTKILSKEKSAVIKDAYFGDINGRITEFRTLFQEGILDNINGLPFEKLKKLPNCSEIKDN